MMGVLNFAHASFYMIGAYFAYAISDAIGFWAALVLAPLAVGMLGMLVERYGLRAVHRHGKIAELLLTFGLSYVIVELVQLIWGRMAVPYTVPAELRGSLFTLYTTTFPVYRAFMMAIALLMLVAIWVLLRHARIGLVIRAALTHPQAVEALGHDVPRIFMWVFGGGCALAGLAGVIGGNAFVTEPGMAHALGSIIFVVVVIGGMGSLAGALLASLIVGVLQTFSVALDYGIGDLFVWFGLPIGDGALWRLTLAQLAPILPYLLLVLVLIVRPRGLLGAREG